MEKREMKQAGYSVIQIDLKHGQDVRLMRILNLYAGIGGNRKPLNGDVISVEIDPAIADVYSRLYPNDEIIIGDAHQYLEKHFSEFDFIWSSPPCPSHGQYRHNVGVLAKGYTPLMPDMRLYAEIVFLQTYFKGKFVVENTKPYYQPLVEPSVILQRHLFWSNFDIPEKKFPAGKIRLKNKISDFENGDIVADSKIKNKRQVLRNCVDFELAEYIYQCAFREWKRGR
jgi:DNA (cytosine-5)-methyltransferase 1